jgi:hypothetical protein
MSGENTSSTPPVATSTGSAAGDRAKLAMQLIGVAVDLVETLTPIIHDAALGWEGVSAEDALVILRKEMARASANLDEYEKQLDANRAAADQIIKAAEGQP